MTAKETLQSAIIDGLSLLDIDTQVDSGIYQLTAVLLLLTSAFVSFKLARLLLHNRTSVLIARSKNNWDNELHKHGFFRRCGHLLPALLIYLLCPLLFASDELIYELLRRAMQIYIIIAVVWAANALFNTVEDVYNASALAKRAPITGFIQVAKLILIILAVLLVVANLLDKSPLILVSGLGAVTAILLLVFRDTILGFVAGIQIAANRMVNTGDWIELPKYGADGEVLEVGLTTVKVRNWDNTVSTVPTYTLITDSVKNWRGMSESGGRRIKRSILIDVQSIHFCDESMLEKYKKIRYIREYIDLKVEELQAFHSQQNIDQSDLVNARRLTNLGTLRAYMLAYLRHHPKVNQDMTLMVRQLPATEVGLPLEIYCFSADKSWVNYEGIQADIFDHLFAMLPIFDLRAYQRVSDSAAVKTGE